MRISRPMFLLAALTGAAMTTSAQVGTGPAQAASPRLRPTPVTVPNVKFEPIWATGDPGDAATHPGNGGTGSRDCQTVSSHTDANFGGGSFVIQGGFAETEIAAAQYVLPAGAFPIRIDLMEFIVAQQSAIVTTTTKWSVLVWEGPPSTGTLVAEYISDDIILPYIIMPPGTQGTNVQVSVDPGDPEQIIINANPSNSFTIGFRIDDHNSQTSNPCLTAPPSNRNAFPTTDTSGLQQASRNWLYGINCGSFGCPPNGGWTTFTALPGFCRPSGDWVMRATWTSVSCTPGVGACCLPSGSCIIATTSDCSAAGGTFQGDGSTCATTNCVAAPQACCFPSTGGCLNLNPADCVTAGGVPGGVGTTCATFTCFPKGACCLVDGTCVNNISPTDCSSLGGTYKGNNSTCATVSCPPPSGSCCFPNGACLSLTLNDCTIAGGSWGGIGSNCADTNGNGQPDACEPDCPSDVNGDTESDILDFLDFIDAFGTCENLPAPCTGSSGVSADFNQDDWVDILDFLDFFDAFGTGCD